MIPRPTYKSSFNAAARNNNNSAATTAMNHSSSSVSSHYQHQSTKSLSEIEKEMELEERGLFGMGRDEDSDEGQNIMTSTDGDDEDDDESTYDATSGENFLMETTSASDDDLYHDDKDKMQRPKEEETMASAIMGKRTNQGNHNANDASSPPTRGSGGGKKSRLLARSTRQIPQESHKSSSTTTRHRSNHSAGIADHLSTTSSTSSWGDENDKLDQEVIEGINLAEDEPSISTQNHQNGEEGKQQDASKSRSSTTKGTVSRKRRSMDSSTQKQQQSTHGVHSKSSSQRHNFNSLQHKNRNHSSRMDSDSAALDDDTASVSSVYSTKSAQPKRSKQQSRVSSSYGRIAQTPRGNTARQKPASKLRAPQVLPSHMRNKKRKPTTNGNSVSDSANRSRNVSQHRSRHGRTTSTMSAFSVGYLDTPPIIEESTRRKSIHESPSYSSNGSSQRNRRRSGNSSKSRTSLSASPSMDRLSVSPSSNGMKKTSSTELLDDLEYTPKLFRPKREIKCKKPNNINSTARSESTTLNTKTKPRASPEPASSKPKAPSSSSTGTHTSSRVFALYEQGKQKLRERKRIQKESPEQEELSDREQKNQSPTEASPHEDTDNSSLDDDFLNMETAVLEQQLEELDPKGLNTEEAKSESSENNLSVPIPAAAAGDGSQSSRQLSVEDLESEQSDEPSPTKTPPSPSSSHELQLEAKHVDHPAEMSSPSEKPIASADLMQHDEATTSSSEQDHDEPESRNIFDRAVTQEPSMRQSEEFSSLPHTARNLTPQESSLNSITLDFEQQTPSTSLDSDQIQLVLDMNHLVFQMVENSMKNNLVAVVQPLALKKVAQTQEEPKLGCIVLEGILPKFGELMNVSCNLYLEGRLLFSDPDVKVFLQQHSSYFYAYVGYDLEIPAQFFNHNGVLREDISYELIVNHEEGLGERKPLVIEQVDHHYLSKEAAEAKMHHALTPATVSSLASGAAGEAVANPSATATKALSISSTAARQQSNHLKRRSSDASFQTPRSSADVSQGGIGDADKKKVCCVIS